MRKKSKVDQTLLTGYKVRIYPTESQRIEIDKNIRIARAVYNLGLEMQNREHEINGGFIRFYPLITEFGRMRNSDPSKSWLKEISINTIRETLHNLDSGFHRFFSGQNRHPKFKSKKTAKKAVSVRSDRTHIKGEYISISGLKDSVILAKDHKIPSGCRLWNTTISTDGYGHYWFSCTIEAPLIDMSDIPKHEAIGIDVGIRNMITTSNGDFYKFSDCSKHEKRLKRQQRRLSKDYTRYFQQSLDTRTKYEDIPKSKNHYKRLADQYKTMSKIIHKRFNDIHTATKQIVDRNPTAIVIENISVQEQLHDKYMRKYAPQMLYYEIHRQLKYKAARRSIPVVIAEKGYASSKICSNCGSMGYLKHRVFRCSHCGYTEDRDLNAAYNLRNLAYQ